MNYKPLEWDSNYFGVKIGHVSECASQSEFREALVAARAAGLQCLYYLCGSNDVERIRWAEEAGCRLTDIRVTLENDFRLKPQVEHREEVALRQATEADEAALKAIVRGAYTLTRFIRDARFKRELAEQMYEIWAARSVHGFADQVLFAEVEGSPAGFISLKHGKRWKIGLFAVDTRLQGKGVGSRLIAEAMRQAHQNGAEALEVVTQEANVPAMRLYEKAGFLFRRSELWYHKWFD